MHPQTTSKPALVAEGVTPTVPQEGSTVEQFVCLRLLSVYRTIHWTTCPKKGIKNEMYLFFPHLIFCFYLLIRYKVRLTLGHLQRAERTHKTAENMLLCTT